MSLGGRILNLARRAYLRFIQIIRPAVRPTLTLVVGVALGATLFGPGGPLAGAATGAVATPTIQSLLRTAYALISGSSLINIVIQLLFDFLRTDNNGHQENEALPQ